jgi:hypothetical protein
MLNGQPAPRTSMATRAAVLAGLAVLGLLADPARAGGIDPAQGCARNPAVIGPCFTVEGRVRVYDGSPTVRIRPKASRRLLGVLPSGQEIMPNDLRQAISPETDILAQLTVCPFTRRETASMQFVCIESARNIRTARRH